jgi:hypothetical protein
LLVINNSGESALLKARNSVAARNDRGEDVTLHGNTKRQRDDIQKEEVRGLSASSLATEDTGLDGGTVGDGLVGVDALISVRITKLFEYGLKSHLLELLSVEEVAEELLDTGNTGGATNENDLINGALLHARVLQDLLDRVQGTRE